MLVKDAAMLVGTSPELEFSLYTLSSYICSYQKQNKDCIIPIKTKKFSIISKNLEYMESDLIVLGYPKLFKNNWYKKY